MSDDLYIPTTEHSEEPTEEVGDREDTVLTAKDPKRVAQGKWLASVSKKAKKDKPRREIMEEEFSYLPYFLYPLAGVSTFLLIVSMFMKRNEVQYEFIPATAPATKEPKENKYEKLG